MQANKAKVWRIVRDAAGRYGKDSVRVGCRCVVDLIDITGGCGPSSRTKASPGEFGVRLFVGCQNQPKRPRKASADLIKT